MKQLEVQIMGQSYLLGCPEGGEQRMLEAVEKVDAAMCKIRDAGKVRARDRIAVLAALNLANELIQQRQGGGDREHELSRTLGDLTRRLDGLLDSVAATR
jgi:cell division protein ZapA (FtsZ GTPase activity inhibitor)